MFSILTLVNNRLLYRFFESYEVTWSLPQMFPFLAKFKKLCVTKPGFTHCNLITVVLSHIISWKKESSGPRYW